ncbi:MAG TPA: Ig-like domain-containing protein [Actinocrinis sp.]|nr:Ig-like domain-containing protein [Actinocrinis sp.]
MSRVLTRALLLTAVGGMALAPAIASATDTAPDAAPPATTITQLTTSKDPQAGEMLTLSARVSPEESGTTDTPPPSTAPTKKPTGNTKGKDTKGTGTKGKDGKSGKGGKDGKGGKGKGTKNGTHPKRHTAETGEVTFTIDGKAQPSIQLARGRATEKLELEAGKHTVVANYSGDQNYSASKSAPLTITVS